jgi:biotin carboxyl carrier protein
MNRFLTVASSALIATGVTVLPVASFAQSSVEAGKTAVPSAQTQATPAQATPAQATPTQATPAAKASATTQTPIVSQDKTRPVKTAPTKTAKTNVTAPMKGKTATHSMNTHAKHHVAKAPVKETTTKG